MFKFSSIKFFFEKTKDNLVIVCFILLSSVLRLVNLGYSDYIGDEHKAFLIPNSGQTVWNFLIEQRKGPMQFFVTYIPRLIVGDFKNELAERLPFSIISIICVLVFYLLISKLTKNRTVAVVSTFLFMVNGFIVGFGRIAQYQNLNIVFSLLSIYFYSDLLLNKSRLIRSTLIGTLFWVLSLFSHWDAVFIAPVVLWFFITFFRDKQFEKNYKLRLFLYNFILGLFLVLPFMIPYVKFHVFNKESTDYFERRIAVGVPNNSLYKMYIDLYNPFLTFWVLSILSFLSVFKFKKSGIFITWFVFCYLIFEILWRKPGTHIYNFLLPVFVLCGFGFDFILDFLRHRILKKTAVLIFALVAMFLYYQSYLLFVDHRKEYPWERETFLSFQFVCKVSPNFCRGRNIDNKSIKTKQYYYDYKGQKLPLFGFPHSRNWDLINEYVNNLSSSEGGLSGYSTNEDQVVSKWYMDVSYRSKGEFYFIGIKNPSNFVNDFNPPAESDKELIKTLYRENGSSYAKIFKVSF